ncbi:MAG: hypothetical protein HQK75_11805 [Candidatus Magnetomorum sp.]|nr:hypothetical protein [Candidatus Magnetomorum sp.]
MSMIEQLDKIYENLKVLRNKTNDQNEFKKIRSQMDQINEQRQKILDAAIDNATEEYTSATTEIKKAQTEIESALDDLSKVASAISKVSKMISQVEKVLIG